MNIAVRYFMPVNEFESAEITGVQYLINKNWC